MRLILIALALLVPMSGIADVSDRGGGKPSSKPLPPYCQMGECFVSTVEATDPIAFSAKGVLFRVESENWHSRTGDLHNLRREADSTSYVLCSKIQPAVIDQTAQHKFMITFLAPEDASSYFHSNQTALALFFTVCHGRSFERALRLEAPVFAERLGYSSKHRDDQPIIASPELILDFIK